MKVRTSLSTNQHRRCEEEVEDAWETPRQPFLLCALSRLVLSSVPFFNTLEAACQMRGGAVVPRGRNLHLSVPGNAGYSRFFLTRWWDWRSNAAAEEGNGSKRRRTRLLTQLRTALAGHVSRHAAHESAGSAAS